ncbi:MAG: chemotaxis protein CheB, partial [Candidatus Sericytochromatia bacterium]
VDILFNSVAEEVGKNSAAVLMTGMGSDGAKGLLKIRESGGKTFIQSEETCVVFGMPGSALRIGATENILNLSNIPYKLMDIFSSH